MLREASQKILGSRALQEDTCGGGAEELAEEVAEVVEEEVAEEVAEVVEEVQEIVGEDLVDAKRGLTENSR